MQIFICTLRDKKVTAYSRTVISHAYQYDYIKIRNGYKWANVFGNRVCAIRFQAGNDCIGYCKMNISIESIIFFNILHLTDECKKKKRIISLYNIKHPNIVEI